MAVGGCGGGSSTEEPPTSGAATVDSTATDDQPGGGDDGGEGGGEGGGDSGGEPDPPGVPGSPITYDHTVKQAGPEGARADIVSKISAQCGPDLCGVSVVHAGTGDCVLSITPPPVQPGGTVTLELGDCEIPPEPEPEPQPEPDTGETTTEAG